MSDLLKEAIADAKAVRETALLNAKAALEEAFTPQLKSMLSAKLKEDEFEDEEIPFEDEFGGGEEELGLEPEIPAEEPVIAPEEGAYEDEIPGEEIPAEEPIAAAPVAPEIPGEEDALDLEAIIRELEQELHREQGVYEQDDAYDENIGKTDTSHLAEQDDAYDEADPGEKSEHVGGSMDGVPALKKEGEESDDDDSEEEMEEAKAKTEDNGFVIYT